MSGRKQALNKVWGILYILGFLLIWFGGMELIQKIKIPSNVQPIIALVSAAIWFTSAFVSRRFPEKTGQFRATRFISFGFGLLQIIFAILIWTVAQPKSHFAMWLGIYNEFLSVFCVSAFYTTLFQFFFPALQPTTPKPRPDPLAEFPETTQEVVKKGAYWVNLPTILTICAFFVIGVIGMAMTTAKSHDEALDFFLIVTGAGFLIAFVIGIIQTYRWQKWALQSGIPEAELKAAAKRAGLWWPKIKEE